jgi:hypothetical protein
MQPLRSLRAPRGTALRTAQRVALYAALGAAAPAAWAAGAVEVRFIDPGR